jgi:hypothetical protein
MRDIQTSPFDTLIVITFHNKGLGENHSWVCANRTIFHRCMAQLEASPHINNRSASSTVSARLRHPILG